jgi:hypothetical protein
VSEHADRDSDTKPLSERMSPEREPAPSVGEAVRPRLPLLAGAALLTIVAVAAGILAGGAYVIAVLVLAVLGWIFYAGQRLLALRGTRRTPSGGLTADEDGDEPIPNVGFDDRTAVGDTEQQPDVAHSEPRSTGAR